MRLSSPSLQSITAATAMSSSRFPARGHRQTWRRGFCDRPTPPPPPDGRGGGAFVSGDSHLRTVRDENLGFRRGYRGEDSWTPRGGAPRQQFRPRPPPPPGGFRPGQPLPGGFRPAPPPRPADYRNWIFSTSQPPPQCERFIVLSYNILADYLAIDHRSELYFHIPHHILDWEWRKRRLFLEFGLWAPDIMCLQEVDRYHDLEEELAIRGYTGTWKMRTGNAIDGCAIFWRTNRFWLRHEEHIEFNKLGLRDNVAQICVLESRTQNAAENQSAQLFASSDQSGVANQVVICNIHVLYNPKRGEIKVGQVRTLLDRAYAVSRIWNDAPVVICGDFNCTPQSPLYKFISEQKLSLPGLARNQVSGQHSARIYSPRPYIYPGSYSARPSKDNSSVSAIGVKQGNCYIGSDIHHEPGSDIEKPSQTEELSSPPSLTSILNIPGKLCFDCENIIGNDMLADAVAKEKDEADVLNGCYSDDTSRKVRLIDSSKGNGRSNKKGSEIPANIEKSGDRLLVASNYNPSSGVQLDCGGSNHSTEMVHSVQSTSADYCCQSSANKSSELINSPDVDASFEDLTPKLADLSAEEKGVSQYFKGTSIMSTAHEDLTSIRKADMSSDRSHSTEVNGENSSGMPSEKAILNKALLDSELSDDDITGVSSLQMPSRIFSAKIEVSMLENMEKTSDLITEPKVDTVTTCQNSTVNISADEPVPGSSSLGLKVDDFDHTDVHETVIEDADLCTVHGNSIRAEKPSRVQELATEYVTSQNSDNYNISSRPNASETSRSFVKSCSAGKTNSDQSENNIDSVDSGSTYVGLSSLEENPDPNFFKDLLGSEDACEQDFSSLQGSVVGGGEVNSGKLGYIHKPELHSSDQNANWERHYYDPYLWTPMEIEIALGNAECTFVEHNLKLKSVYTSVEDYAGTKDSSGEPQVTSYNRQFMGTVDYIWCSEGLDTVKVLDTIPKHVLRRTPGYPTPKWGSDHLALACQLAFTKGFRTSR